MTESPEQGLATSIDQQGAQGLLSSLFPPKPAIQDVLGAPSSPHHAALRRGLLDIVLNRSAQMHSVLEAVDEAVQRAAPAHGPGHLIMKGMAGMEQQIAAISHLAPFAASDDEVYDALWLAAQGKTRPGCVVNAQLEAQRQLSLRAVPARQDRLFAVAHGFEEKVSDRILAYKILAGHSLFTNPAVYEAVCDLAGDRSLIEPCAKLGRLSPDGEFWYNSRMERCKRNSEDCGNKGPEMKLDAAYEAQSSLRNGFFAVVGYALEQNAASYDEMQKMNTLQDGVTTQRLTRTLCAASLRRPSFRAEVLCKYAEAARPVSREEGWHILETLESLSRSFAGKNDERMMSLMDAAAAAVQHRLDTGAYIESYRLRATWEGDGRPHR